MSVQLQIYLGLQIGFENKVQNQKVYHNCMLVSFLVKMSDRIKRSEKESIIIYNMQGTLVNPIDLDLDSPQPEQDIELQLEQARKKQLLQQAKLSRNGIELALAVIKTTIKGQLKIKNQTLNRAIIKYFRNRIGMNVSCEHFHPRREPEYENNPINPLQFLLYGVDFLSTAMIQDRFKLIDTTLQEIMWIDSSCCKLIFKTESEAKMVLESQVIDKRTLEFKLDEESDGRLQGWFNLRPYHFLNFQRQLIMRYATQNEKVIPKEEMNKYKEYQAAYAELLPTLFEEFNAVQAFEEVIKEIDREKFEDIQNRNQYHRNRRVRYFNNRQPSRQRNERMDRSRTRDKKYQNYNNQGRRNQNFHDRDRNTSFEFRGRASNRHQQSNEINTSFQMVGRADSNHQRGDNNTPNTSFEMRPSRSFQNRQNNRNNGMWARNNNPANHNEFEAKVVHQVVYEHRPVDEKQMNTSQLQMGPPRKQNVYFDCNGIDDEQNLSYEFRSHVEDNNEESDHLEEMAMNFNQRPQHNKSRQTEKQDLSFLIKSLNNSKEDYVHKKLDDSFRFTKQTHQNVLNKSLNDCSFVMDTPKASERVGEEKQRQKLDFNQLFHLHDQDDISPIHNNKNDTSFVMKDPQNENRNYANKRNDDSFLDFKKPIKNKKKERFIDEDDGY